MSCSLMEHHPRLCCWTCRPVQHPCTCGSSGVRVCGGTKPERHRPHIHVHLTRQHLCQNHHREHVLTWRDPAIVFTNGRTTVNLTGNAGFDIFWCSIVILITIAASESGLFCCVMPKMWLFTVPLLVRTHIYINGDAQSHGCHAAWKDHYFKAVIIYNRETDPGTKSAAL